MSNHPGFFLQQEVSEVAVVTTGIQKSHSQINTNDLLILLTGQMPLIVQPKCESTERVNLII